MILMTFKWFIISADVIEIFRYRQFKSNADLSPLTIMIFYRWWRKDHFLRTIKAIGRFQLLLSHWSHRPRSFDALKSAKPPALTRRQAVHFTWYDDNGYSANLTKEIIFIIVITNPTESKMASFPFSRLRRVESPHVLINGRCFIRARRSISLK